MSELRAARNVDGSISLEDIPPAVAQLMRELPGLLGPDQPDVVKRRLFPVPSKDEDVAAEWRRAQHPELFALLADAKAIVERDVASLVGNRRKRSWRLDIPAAHVAAWISAINAARLTLGAMHDVVAADMHPEREPTADERGLAILRIDLYAWLQGTLIDADASGG